RTLTVRITRISTATLDGLAAPHPHERISPPSRTSPNKLGHIPANADPLQSREAVSEEPETSRLGGGMTRGEFGRRADLGNGGGCRLRPARPHAEGGRPLSLSPPPSLFPRSLL